MTNREHNLLQLKDIAVWMSVGLSSTPAFPFTIITAASAACHAGGKGKPFLWP